MYNTGRGITPKHIDWLLGSGLGSAISPDGCSRYGRAEFEHGRARTALPYGASFRRGGKSEAYCGCAFSLCRPGRHPGLTAAVQPLAHFPVIPLANRNWRHSSSTTAVAPFASSPPTRIATPQMETLAPCPPRHPGRGFLFDGLLPPLPRSRRGLILCGHESTICVAGPSRRTSSQSLIASAVSNDCRKSMILPS